jgi:hypothetical protein
VAEIRKRQRTSTGARAEIENVAWDFAKRGAKQISPLVGVPNVRRCSIEPFCSFSPMLGHPERRGWCDLFHAVVPPRSCGAAGDPTALSRDEPAQ